MEEIELACRYLKVNINLVVKWRLEGDTIVMLIDHGIGGIKKYRALRKELICIDVKPEIDATESALTLITENGVDATLIEGTGKDGRITAADVRRFLGVKHDASI